MAHTLIWLLLTCLCVQGAPIQRRGAATDVLATVKGTLFFGVATYYDGSIPTPIRDVIRRCMYKAPMGLRFYEWLIHVQAAHVGLRRSRKFVASWIKERARSIGSLFDSAQQS
ncbi:hypothetical protein DFQ30_003082 [Apophysomyces sp. BC1015]|nr:hypothetical protein DFQ30_003082 [Apophysomyces sp. BC1015]